MAAVGPNALLVNADLQILKSYGDVSRYVSINSGAVTTTITSLLVSPYRQDIQFAVPNVIRNQTTSKGVVRTNDGDNTLRERITIYPLENGIDEEKLALVVFDRWHEDHAPLDQNFGDNGQAASQD